MDIISDFHKLYYEMGDQTWKKTIWLGIKAEKCPFDLWVYQEIIFEVRPDVIIETGTYRGGATIFLASICDFINHGRIITIDVEDGMEPRHKRVTQILGSSISPEVITRVNEMINDEEKVMVILDSLHSKDHVSEELDIYSKFVSKGSYLIVEDTNINGNPVEPNFGPSSMEAVIEFLDRNKNFKSDRSREKFLVTFNPKGYLIRER